MPKEQYEYSFLRRDHIQCETVAETLTEALEKIGITHFIVEYEFYKMAVVTQPSYQNKHLPRTFGVTWIYDEDEHLFDNKNE